MSATLVVILILALFVGLYFYVANDLTELIEHERMLDEIWRDESVGASVGPQSMKPYDWDAA